MKPRNLILSIVLAFVLIVAFSVAALLIHNLTRMLPQEDGIVYVNGLHDTVTIRRDELGIPHIYASNPDDLFFAQGYVQAQDRWWQMEFQRHTGLGSISELTGYNNSALSSDLYIRTWGWNRAAANDEATISDETRAIADAYTAGVNAYIAGRHGGDLALEYMLLALNGVNIPIEPWRPVDSLAWAKVMAWNLGGNADTEMDRLALFQALDPRLVEAYYPPYSFAERPTIVTEDDLPLTGASLTGPAPTASSAVPRPGLEYAARNAAAEMAGGRLATALLPERGTEIGSNNWVIAGANTQSGLPLLANDMHLGIQMPSIWYEIGLHCRPVSEECPYDVVGFSFVGVPTVIAGHNGRIAWGETNVGPDTQDLYIIRTNPDDPYQYEYNGEWRTMEVATEVIRIGGKHVFEEDDPNTPACEGIRNLPVDDAGNVVIEVRLTHFGPIITDNTITDDCEFVGQTRDGDPLALRWTALEPGDLLRAFIGINRAGNWEDFRTALTYFDWPAQNLIFADIEGNIGYQMPGKIPVRAGDHTGLDPVPGWTDAYEWRGYIPFDNLPRILNPERGWIVTANNAVVPPDYAGQLARTLSSEFGPDANYTISREWAEGNRAERIEEMVSASRAHTVRSIAEIHGDNHNINAEDLLPYLVDIPLADDSLAEVVQWLAGWDLQNYMESPQAALFEAFWVILVDDLYNDQLPWPTYGPIWATRLLLAQPDHPWWDDIRTPEIETRDDILVRSLQRAVSDMTAAYGADRAQWRWGDMHTATFVNRPLGQSGISFIENLFNAGPVRTSGGNAIVNATGYSVTAPFSVRSVPSQRAIYDLSDFENSQSIHTTGQSGHPFSPHYSDMVESWRQIRYHPMRFGDRTVEAATASLQELRPSPLGRTGKTE